MAACVYRLVRRQQLGHGKTKYLIGRIALMFRPRRTNLRLQVLIQWAKKEISATFFWVQRAMKGKLESADTVSLKGNVWKFFLSSAEQGKGS